MKLRALKNKLDPEHTLGNLACGWIEINQSVAPLLVACNRSWLHLYNSDPRSGVLLKHCSLFTL